ncbi:hypothetical protein [Parapedobacter sp. DT-150]|uniref:hypothetical protein n=1 Tax=Parapedobacter sp. DT-150 TaxID=3396162 RepID=UPI003F1C1407
MPTKAPDDRVAIFEAGMAWSSYADLVNVVCGSSGIASARALASHYTLPNSSG